MIYLDHNSTTPTHREVVESMLPHLRTGGNPASRHGPGRQALAALEEARSRVASLIGCRASEVLFTSGGTEANNLAILGVAGVAASRSGHVVVSAIEHHSVLEAVGALESRDFEVTRVPPDASGWISPEAMAAAVREDTCLVSMMSANNETGVVQPVTELVQLLGDRQVLVHTDAVQAVGRVPVDASSMGVDLLTLSGHKFGGPLGVGALVVRSRTELAPLQLGGGQESGLRAGTHNLPGAVGLGVAAQLASRGLMEDGAYLEALRARLEEGLRLLGADILLAGAERPRLPNTTLACFQGEDGTAMADNLDQLEVAVSTGAACTVNRDEPSHVLLAMGMPLAAARGAVRFSLGLDNTAEEIDLTLERLAGVLGRRGRKGIPGAVRQVFFRR